MNQSTNHHVTTAPTLVKNTPSMVKPPPYPQSILTTTTSSYPISCICRTPEICREISRRWVPDLGQVHYSKYVKLPRRTLMDVIDNNAKVGKHISAYRKSALQCLGYTVEEGDGILGRLGVGVVERISIVHFHPDVIQALFFQEEDHPPAAAESKRSYLRSGRKRKLDRGRIPYAIGTRLGMKENECHLSPTLDSSGMITLFALPNYNLNHAAIDVADTVIKRDWGNLYCTSSNGSMTTTMGNPSLEEYHTRTLVNPVTTTNTPVHDEPSIEL